MSSRRSCLLPKSRQRLNQVASQSGKGTNEMVRELVTNCLDHDQCFRQEAANFFSLDRGRFVSHEEVCRPGRKLGLQQRFCGRWKQRRTTGTVDDIQQQNPWAADPACLGALGSSVT